MIKLIPMRVLSALAISVCAIPLWATVLTAEDPYLWLEEIESTKSLDWVNKQNETSLPILNSTDRYQAIEKDVRKILLSKDRILYPAIRGNFVYNFWQDETNVRGLWRRTLAQNFLEGRSQWETVLDLDALAAAEGENWVWKGSHCLGPQYKRCLLFLSRGGKDALVIREFDTEKKTFVEGGFVTAESKGTVTWIDEDTLIISNDFGQGTMTLSGYPRQARLWKRGQTLESAKIIHEGLETDMSVGSVSYENAKANYSFIYQASDFWTRKKFLVRKQKLVPVPFPDTAYEIHVFNHFYLAVLSADWNTPDQLFKAGTVLSLPVNKMGSPDFLKSVEVVYSPTERSAFKEMTSDQTALYLSVLENVEGTLYKFKHTKKGWVRSKVALPSNGSLELSSADANASGLFVTYQNFLQPTSLYFLKNKGAPKLIQQLPSQFDASPMETHQYESTSSDGTKIPYYIVHRKDWKLDGQNPVLQYGYGGFNISQTPTYSATTGKVWLEKGGVYVLTNIRGGGEFGPKWHTSVLKENRQLAFDDFISVSEDLIRRQITSPQKLGIRGGSNGGLLMGASFTQRPELFNAVICSVPLLDMMRFHKLLAGHSWTAEYGNPDKPEEAKYILKYSPYQKVQKEKKYPKVFFMTSTKDDRVHPGHARKMVAKMLDQGHPVLYFENTEGGHSAAANLEQSTKSLALQFSYLFQQLVD